MGSRLLGDPAVEARATVSSSNHVGRRTFTPIPSDDCANLTCSPRKLNRRDCPCWNEYVDIVYVPDDICALGFEISSDAANLPINGLLI